MATISFSLESDLPKAIAWTESFQKQLRYAASRGLNDVAYQVRNQVRSEMPSRFTIRKPWVVSQLDVLQRSSKDDLSAIIGPKPTVPFLNRQELGGVKLPRGNWVAVPTKMVRRTKTQLISKADRPAQLGDKAYVEQYKGNYWLALKGGKGARQRGANRNLRFLYLLTRRANVRPRLGLGEIGLPIARRSLAEAIAMRLEQAMSTAR